MTGYDVVIVGGGPSGLAFARALDGSGLRVAIVERQPRGALATPPSDGRDIALTHRSANILRTLGAWDAIDPADISPLVMAKVSNGASSFALTFDTEGRREERLGWLVPNHRIREALFGVTLPSAEIDRLTRLDEATLARELTRRYRHRLGALTLVDAPKVYPLATTWARRFATARAALIGDAAVGMHPVTAHGFNLGLMGAATLAELVTRAAGGGRDIASDGLLRRYDIDHRRASWPIYAATNAIVRLYTARDPAARIARAAGLRVAARGPVIRRAVSGLLMRH